MIKGSNYFILSGFTACMEMALTHAGLCMDSEQEALLKIKEGFIKNSDPFSSWTAEKYCCKWRGDGCDNTSGHVTILYLYSQDPFNLLHGEISPLLDLPYLKFLDLSLNILVLFNI